MILKRAYLRYLSILIFLPQKGIRKKEAKSIPHSNLIIYLSVGVERINCSATLTTLLGHQIGPASIILFSSTELVPIWD